MQHIPGLEREHQSADTTVRGGSPLPTVFGITRTIPKKNDDSRAKMLLEEIWNDGLESGIPINSISMGTFLEQFDKKMVLSRTREIEMPEITWFYFRQKHWRR